MARLLTSHAVTSFAEAHGRITGVPTASAGPSSNCSAR